MDVQSEICSSRAPVGAIIGTVILLKGQGTFLTDTSLLSLRALNLELVE